MRQKLSVRDLRWMSEDELRDWQTIPCILEVDLDYPDELQESHNEYPLAPERVVPPDGKVEKLIPNLMDKRKYVLHHENLKLCLRLGLRITKIHRGIIILYSRYKNT